MTFADLSFGTEFEFVSLDPSHDLTRGPWKKTGIRTYIKPDGPVFFCKVVSVNVKVRKIGVLTRRAAECPPGRAGSR